MRAFVTPLMGAVLICSLQDARGGSACPQPASSAPSASSAVVKCSKAPARKAAHAATQAAPVTPSAAPGPAVTTSWKGVLDPLSAGGWSFISDGPPENPSAVYASSHSVMRNGNVVSAWMRWEFSRPQAEVYPLHYLSAVTREELDCDERTYRRSAVFYYLRNNLQEKGPSFTALRDDTTWKQAIPGTEADAMLNWGCTPPAAKLSEKPLAAAKPAKLTAIAVAASSAPAAPPSGATDVHTVR
jgi:hypothetical protein